MMANVQKLPAREVLLCKQLFLSGAIMLGKDKGTGEDGTRFLKNFRIRKMADWARFA